MNQCRNDECADGVGRGKGDEHCWMGAASCLAAEQRSAVALREAAYPKRIVVKTTKQKGSSLGRRQIQMMRTKLICRRKRADLTHHPFADAGPRAIGT